jgi:hypothetical protein
MPARPSGGTSCVFKTEIFFVSQGAKPVLDNRPRTLADVRHATTFGDAAPVGEHGDFGES